MTSFSPLPLAFSVTRCEPGMVVPAQPTPYEVKSVSDIDAQVGNRFHIPFMLFYQKDVGMEHRDPAKVVREAIARALVYYYPFAGRLREGPEGKLMVECTGEGVMFLEADASVRLEQFGDVIQPPFPCLDELNYNVPGSDGIINCPLLLIQVTRLMCGGFILSVRFNHVMCDGLALSQFLKVVTEMVPGARVQSVPPVWERQLLNARDPPQVSCVQDVYQDLTRGKVTTQAEDSNNFPPVLRSFFFGPQEMKVLRNQLAPHLRKCSTFELLTACLWRCRTISLGRLDLDEEVRLAFPVYSRTICNPPLPVGFYGNAYGITVAVSTVGKLCQNPLGYTLDLVRNAETKVTDEFMRSLADVLVKMGRPLYVCEQTYVVSDLTQLGLNDINFGWGKPLYAGAAGEFPPKTSFFVNSKDNKGEDGVLVTVGLAAHSMEIFVRELEKMIEGATCAPTR